MLATKLRNCTFIVWDEAPMMNRYCFEAVDRTLQDLMKNNFPFGGKTVLFAGDFRQILPVIRHGTPAHIIDASINRSKLWKYVTTLHLTINMRLKGDPGNVQLKQFSDFLLRIGEGREMVVDGEDTISIPKSMFVDSQSVDDLIQKVFDSNYLAQKDPKKLISRAILSPQIKDCLEINQRVLEIFPGTPHTYSSSDSIDDPEGLRKASHDFTDFIPVEYLNTLSISGFPPHSLTLKENVVIICLRNLNPKIGLCNGTRLICKQFLPHVIEAEIANGSFAGTRVFLPRITLTTTDSGLPFQLKRRQFPVNVAFSMSINKSQSQSLERVGIYLPQPVFSHGQLYVALSRATSYKDVWIMTHTGQQTRNVVFKQILENTTLLSTTLNFPLEDGLSQNPLNQLRPGIRIHVWWDDDDGSGFESGTVKSIQGNEFTITYDFLRKLNQHELWNSEHANFPRTKTPQSS
jgi:ATP-dependent DNA helicase PIF1